MAERLARATVVRSGDLTGGDFINGDEALGRLVNDAMGESHDDLSQ
jgi:hypothetical protein